MNILIEFIVEYKEMIIIVGSIIIYLIIDFILRRKNTKLKKTLYEKYNIADAEGKSIAEIENIDEEDQLTYYKNKNVISFLRFGILFFVITFYIIHKLPNFFSFFAIAVGAIIITFKEVILCFIGFFYISTQYKIGDEIVVNDGKGDMRGEVIYLNMLNIGLIGRDENGENNGQFYRVPNYKFFTESIKREDISLHKYKKEEVILLYAKKDYEISFDEYMEKLTGYLDEILPKRNMSSVGNYKTYIGYKYKIKFQYDEKEHLMVKVRFIVRPRNIFEIEKGIFSFVESLKK
ncbi:MAG: hypothetical protein AB7E37_00305 [Candidatus Altimarinota bacterium]